MFKLRFTSSRLDESNMIFHVVDNSSMAAMLADTLNKCDRVWSRGETEQCVSSVEDVIDWAGPV